MNITKRTTWLFKKENKFEVCVSVENHIDTPQSKNCWSTAIKIFPEHKMFDGFFTDGGYLFVEKTLNRKVSDFNRGFDENGELEFYWVEYEYKKLGDDYLHNVSDESKAVSVFSDVKKILTVLED
jgi:hypothetical protein